MPDVPQINVVAIFEKAAKHKVKGMKRADMKVGLPKVEKEKK